MTDDPNLDNPFRTPRDAAEAPPPPTAERGAPRDWEPIQAVTFAWEALRAHPITIVALVLAIAVQMVIPIISGGVQFAVVSQGGRDAQLMSSVISVFFSLLNVPIQIWMTLGIARFCLAVARGSRPEWSSVLDGTNFLAALLTALLFMVVGIPAFGFAAVFLVGPGIAVLAANDGGVLGVLLLAPGALVLVLLAVYVALRLMWWIFVIVDGESSPVQAVKTSFALSKGQVLSLLVYFLLTMAVGIAALFLGMCPGLFVGLLVTVPAAQAIAQIALAHGYLARRGEVAVPLGRA